MSKLVLAHLFSFLQYLLPHHVLSRLMHKAARCQNQGWKNAFIRVIVRAFKVNMAEAQQPDPLAYPSFNAFFTRALKPGARPLCGEPDALLCPADGAISQLGDITKEGRIFQAKGMDYDLVELLGGDAQRAEPFKQGKFATVYLSPRDYHRLHLPLDGVLREMVLVPGRLFSVNASTVETVPRLFARNERVVSIFDTESGPMAMVLVGAIFVASIETVWHGEVTPPTVPQVKSWVYGEGAPSLAKGEEMGRFNMGSTIILLMGNPAVEWEASLQPGVKVKMGQKFGRTGKI